MLPTPDEMRRDEIEVRRNMLLLAAVIAGSVLAGWMITLGFTAVNAARIAAEMAGVS